jgi:hypothetical protein
MNERWHCSNCYFLLDEGKNATRCTWCKADADKSFGWSPVKEVAALNALPGAAAIQAIFRMLVGTFAWVVLVALAIFSAVPYGGGSKPLFALALIATVCIPLWALWPALKSTYLLLTRKGTNQ